MFTGPVVQWIVRKSPELDIPVRFWAGLQIKKWLITNFIDGYPKRNIELRITDIVQNEIWNSSFVIGLILTL